MSYFSEKELRCKCCDKYVFNPNTLAKLNALREEIGHALIVTSGYRCKDYNKHIGATQTHASGEAVDIQIRGRRAFNLIKLAMKHNFTGIGVSQKGDSRFIHLDTLDHSEGVSRPFIWSY